MFESLKSEVAPERLLGLFALIVGSLIVWIWLGVLIAGPLLVPWVLVGAYCIFQVCAMVVMSSESKRYGSDPADPSSVLPSQTGVVLRTLDPVGQARFGAEIWRARSQVGGTIDEGTEVRVVARDGLELAVEPVTDRHFPELTF